MTTRCGKLFWFKIIFIVTFIDLLALEFIDPFIEDTFYGIIII